VHCPERAASRFENTLVATDTRIVKRICSWCGVIISMGSTKDAVITHSICKACVAKVEQEMDEWERANKRNK
jgi:hypothetical protein